MPTHYGTFVDDVHVTLCGHPARGLHTTDDPDGVSCVFCGVRLVERGIAPAARPGAPVSGRVLTGEGNALDVPCRGCGAEPGKACSERRAAPDRVVHTGPHDIRQYDYVAALRAQLANADAVADGWRLVVGRVVEEQEARKAAEAERDEARRIIKAMDRATERVHADADAKVGAALARAEAAEARVVECEAETERQVRAKCDALARLAVLSQGPAPDYARGPTIDYTPATAIAQNTTETDPRVLTDERLRAAMAAPGFSAEVLAALIADDRRALLERIATLEAERAQERARSRALAEALGEAAHAVEDPGRFWSTHDGAAGTVRIEAWFALLSGAAPSGDENLAAKSEQARPAVLQVQPPKDDDDCPF